MNPIHGELASFLAVGIGSNRTNLLACLLVHVVGAPLVAASVAGYLAWLLISYISAGVGLLTREIESLDRQLSTSPLCRQSAAEG